MNKRTLIALGVFGALLLAVVLTREDKVEVGVQKLELPKIDRALIVALEVSGPHSASLRKEPNGWFVVDPNKPDRSHPVDEAQVDSVLDAVSSFKVSQLVTENADRHAELEVDEAKGTRVRVSGASGPVADLIFGKSAQGGGTYVRQASRPQVFTTSSSISFAVRKDASGWRKRALISTKADDITRLSVQHADGTLLELERVSGAWKLPESAPVPEGFRFDASAVDRMVQQLTSLSAQEFLDEPGNSVALGLEPPATVVKAVTKDGVALQIHLGHQSTPEQLKAISSVHTHFSTLDGNADGVLSAEELSKAENDASPEVKEVAARLKDPGLVALIDGKGVRGESGDGALSREDVEAANRRASLVPVRINSEPQHYLIPHYAAQGLGKRLADLRDLSLLSMPPEEVEKLELMAKGRRVVLAKNAEGWKVVEPKKLPSGFTFEPAQVPVQLNALKNLRASRWVESATEAEAGVNKPVLSVTLVGKGGATQVLRLGNERTGPTGVQEVFARGAMDAHLYALPVFERNRLEAGLELFKKQPRPSMEGLQGLDALPPEIRAKLEAQLRQQLQQ